MLFVCIVDLCLVVFCGSSLSQIAVRRSVLCSFRCCCALVQSMCVVDVVDCRFWCSFLLFVVLLLFAVGC